jgi:hypothetical protein
LIAALHFANQETIPDTACALHYHFLRGLDIAASSIPDGEFH